MKFQRAFLYSIVIVLTLVSLIWVAPSIDQKSVVQAQESNPVSCKPQKYYGILHCSYIDPTSGAKIEFLRIDGDDPHIEFQVAAGDYSYILDSKGETSNFICTDRPCRYTIKTMVEKWSTSPGGRKAVAAINTDYAGETDPAQGPVWINGDFKYQYYSQTTNPDWNFVNPFTGTSCKRKSLTITQSNNFSFGWCMPGFNVSGGGPQYVVNGQVKWDYDDYQWPNNHVGRYNLLEYFYGGGWGENIDAQSGAGISSDGKYLILAAAPGPGHGSYSKPFVGMSSRTMAEKLATVKLMGATSYNAMRFDSGGSTQVFYDGKYIVKSDECNNLDPLDDSRCRPVAAGLIVYSDPILTSSRTEIKSPYSGKCADMTDFSVDNGANLQQWDCWGGLNQQWDLKYVKTVKSGLWPTVKPYYEIISANSGKCLDVYNWSKDDKGQVVQWDCHGGSNQLWSVEKVRSGNYRIQNLNSGKCLDLSGWSKENGAWIFQYSCTGKENQEWKLAEGFVFPKPILQDTIFRIYPYETKQIAVAVQPDQASSIMSLNELALSSSDVLYGSFITEWPGSDVITTLTSPSGRVISRDTADPDVEHTVSGTDEIYTIANPEIGDWQVSFYGADVSPDGEEVTFTFISSSENEPPQPQLAYMDGDTLILNMGTEERRKARNLSSEEINEVFSVKQLSSSLPGEFSVSAFDLTQTFTGVTNILANADDGNDVITLEAGDVPFTAPAEIHGGSGDDRIQSGDGYDTVSGDEGNDWINAGGGDDTITGGDGSDELNGQAGSDTINGGAGNDTVNGGSDADVLHGDDGDDTILGEAGNDQIYGNAGQDKLFGGAGDDEIYGGADADQMEGGDGADRMFGEGGADEMYGQAGADELHGGPGNDKLYGGDGNDTLNGDEDNDLIEGNEGADTISGGSGDDRLLGQAGPDYMSGGDGIDLMYGNDGDDQMFGDAGVDQMYGNEGDDQMSGGAGDDYMEGNQGADVMQGDDGQDDLIGGTPAAGTPDGADTLYGGSGHDVLVGDNAVITRPDGIQPANFAADAEGVIIRSVTLFDIATTTAQAADGAFAGDKLFGEDGRDVLYGQGGDDTISGGTGDDYAEGNAGKDTIAGDAGQDDLIGGTGRINDDPSQGTNGRLDDADTIYGESDTTDGAADGSGADMILGDNGIITRKLDANGAWINTSYNGTVTRQIVLLDVATTSTVVDPNVSAGDRIWGNDNDDILYGQGGEDEIYGGSGDDYIEGNAASDILSGDDGDDDLLGGSGPTANGAPETLVAGLIDASTLTRAVPLGTNPAVNVPLGDVMYGGAGSDVMLGDNGMITRPMDENGVWKTLNYALFLDTNGYQAQRHPTSGMGTRVTRSVVFVDLAPGQTAGSDLMYGGAGDDDLYGQFDDTAGPIQPAIGDEMFGEAGEDAMVGDLGSIDSSVVATATKTIRPPEPFFDDDIFIQNTLLRQVTLLQAAIGGNDRMSGGSGGDWMHAGAGDDLMNGNSGNDRLFGDDGNDAIWGGANHDHLWGGTGNDSLDIKPRLSMLVGNGKNSMGKQTLIPTDPLEWFAYADKDNFQDIDYIYGGWGQDAMQADIGDTGPVPGDRLIDWTGGYNAYYLCPGLYGERVVTRNHSPKIVDFLQALAAGDGAIDPTTVNSSGYGEVGMVFSADIRFNANPAHPDNPGHYTCP